jgi:uracil-DNA glycosylase
MAIVPMGFCYPGTGKSGDLPPRPECAEHWRARLLASLPNIRLTLVIGQYALAWHLPAGGRQSVAATVRAWRDHPPGIIPLPHPSPRNNRWLKLNPWFEAELVPHLRQSVASILGR